MQEDSKAKKGDGGKVRATSRKPVYLDDFAELAGFAPPKATDDMAWQDWATRDPAFLLKNL